MQTNALFSQEQIEEYLPNVQDEKAASMLQLLLNDVNNLENQVMWQKERMRRIHDNLQKYTDVVIKKIMHIPDNHSLNN
jgi:5-methylthioribose kinase